MKKLLNLVLIGALSLSLTACGNSSSKDNPSSKETTTKKTSINKWSLDVLTFSFIFYYFLQSMHIL